VCVTTYAKACLSSYAELCPALGRQVCPRPNSELGRDLSRLPCAAQDRASFEKLFQKSSRKPVLTSFGSSNVLRIWSLVVSACPTVFRQGLSPG